MTARSATSWRGLVAGLTWSLLLLLLLLLEVRRLLHLLLLLQLELLLLRHPAHHPVHALTHHHLLLHLLELLWVESAVHHAHIRLGNLHVEMQQSRKVVWHLTKRVCLVQSARRLPPMPY